MREAQTEGWVVCFDRLRRVDEIEQLKGELVSTVSHELKTPLASVKAYSATLRQNPSLREGQREEFLAIIEQQADRLTRMIDDMLLVARVDGDQLLRQRVTIPVEPLVAQALAEVVVDAGKHSVEVRVGDARVSGDPERLRDLLRNLIENAVKYSPRGGTISITADEKGGRTQIDVRDHGIGIDDEHLPYIFDRFYRVEPDATSLAGGSGLGLYIVNALTRAHGGRIDVRSKRGEGTLFTVNLPLR